MQQGGELGGVVQRGDIVILLAGQGPPGEVQFQMLREEDQIFRPERRKHLRVQGVALRLGQGDKGLRHLLWREGEQREGGSCAPVSRSKASPRRSSLPEPFPPGMVTEVRKYRTRLLAAEGEMDCSTWKGGESGSVRYA